MSSNRTEPRNYPTEILSDARLRDLLDSAVNSAVARTVDAILGNGARKGFESIITPTQTSPLGLTIDIPAFQGYDGNGQHLRESTATEDFDCSVDYLGQATVPTTGHRYCSIFVFFDWTNSDPVIVDSVVYYRLRTENTLIRLYRGTSVPLDQSPIPPTNPGNGAIRLCNIHITAGQTTIVNADIHVESTHQDKMGSCILGGGGSFLRSPTGIRGGRLFEVRSGETNFAEEFQIVGSDPVTAGFCPQQLHGAYSVNAVLNHGFQHRNVMVHKRINMADATTYQAAFIDLSDVVQTNMVAWPDPGHEFPLGLLWTFNYHDGSENYQGMTGLMAIGRESWCSSMFGRGIIWSAFMDMAEV